ncbi:unnamed protein product [Nezara viridula]|uniref:Titin n=1 Tax=Nezara viridula TaxID=85310 RepID=A0A9P0H1B1_NEZVI|nr:unnamed protein product [Nezara viridula]
MTGKVKLPRKKKPVKFSEEADSETIYIKEEIEESPEQVKFPLRRKSSTTPYNVEEVEEEIQLGLRSAKPRSASVVYEEESLELKVKRKPSKPSITSFHQEGASLQITKLVEEFGESETKTEGGQLLFSICSYTAETDDALNLVEGERVYIIESTNSDWWFVKKHLTEEKGWVPAVYLRDEPSYTLYVQKKLHEKIDKLPIFEKPGPGTEVNAPKFVEKLQPKHVPDGATVQFECKVVGNPRPQITWFRQTAIIKPSHDFQIFYDDDNVATLIISEVFPEDAGTFTCVAKNAAGFASSTTELVVETPLSDHGSETGGLSRRSLSRESSLADILEGIPPTFSKKPKAKVAPVGSNVELEVRLVAVPEPDIIWSFKGKQITIDQNKTIITSSDMHMYSSILSLKNITQEEEGTYTVVAKNREGEASLDITLKLKPKGEEGPFIVEPLRDVSATEGEGIILSTTVTGSPSPKVTWLKDGNPVKGTEVSGDTYTLTLRDVKPIDAGKYILKATNKRGTVETSAQLNVLELKRAQAPLFVERFEEQKVQEKGTIRLTAKVIGNPIPSITWLRNNKTLLASPRITEMFDGEQILLEIEKADSEQDSGDYKCVATNPIGSATHGARVTIDVAKVTFTKSLPKISESRESYPLTLECETSHTVSTTWYHNGVELSGMDHRELVQEGRKQMLVFKRVLATDKGTYTCSVKDQKTSTTLKVQEVKPDFVRKLEDFEVKEQECAVLEVEISSEAANVIWEKDGMPLEPIKDKIEIEKRGPIHKLFIRSTSVHDEGEYTCRLGNEECTAEVTVIELPPEILTPLSDTTVPRGEKALFEVELTKGDALVRWFKDDTEIQFSEHIQLSIDGKRQRLKIYQAKDSDAGVYTCQVGDQKSKAKLTVQEPKVEFITRLPDVTMLPVGSDAEFVVELSRSDVEVKWLKKGKEIKQSDKFIISSDGPKHKLIIKKVTLEDQSDYSCIAMNIKTTTKLKIEVIETAPKIQVAEKTYKVQRGEDVEIVVKFTGTPKPSAEWSVNGTVIIPNKRISSKVEEDSATLTIKKVVDTDVGNYVVKLKNSVGEASAELTLIIIDVPDAPGIPEVVEITNTSITLHWAEPKSDGNSPIKCYILEHHDKEEFLTWHEITEISSTTHKVTKLVTGHEMMFRVSAVNSVGRGKTSDSSRYIKIQLPTGGTAPTVCKPLNDTASGLGSSVTLECVISGFPQPEVKWFKDGKPLKTKTITYTDNVAKLTISKCVEISGGVYSCKATNSSGTAETNCKLTIQDIPTLSIDNDQLSVQVGIASQWKPIITYSGYPKPELKWFKDGKQLVEDKRIKCYIDEKSTTIAIYSTERIDSGIYTVKATNIAGTATLDLNLRVIDKPSCPQSVQIKDIESESVTVCWQPPVDDGGVDISKYSLEKCEISKKIWTKVADIERDARSYSVQRLLTNAEYMFRIFAQNPVGVSEPAESESVRVQSKYGLPSAPEGPLEISGMTDTSCTLSWGVPFSDGGTPILDYLVERRESGNAWIKIGSTKELHIVTSSLKKGVSYEFKVSARNRVGEGQSLLSDQIIAGTKKTPPSPPENVQVTNIASKSVTLTWEPPLSNGGSELTGYVIEKQAVMSNLWTKVVTLDATVTNYTVENLKEKSEFYFRVFAENGIGLSFPTTTSLVSLKTHATVPSPPTAPLEVRSTGATSVFLAWGVPESDGGAPLEGYKVAVRDVKKTMWMEVGRVSADVQRLTVKDLQENHEYLIRIFARNEVGFSKPLESDEPFRVQRPTVEAEDTDLEELGFDKETPSLSFTTTTTQSWMREAGMDADIYSYSRSSLLRRSEYFFRIWYYAKNLFQ